MNTLQRRAVWEVHAKRCNYCREPLLFRALELDHIIPRKLAANTAEWSQLRSEECLDDNFDIDGFENLVPACRRCNAAKAAMAFAPGRITIELNIARRFKPRIEELVRKLEEIDYRDRVHAALATGIASGQVKMEDLLQLEQKVRNDAGIFRLSPSAWLFAEQPMLDINITEAERYLSKRINLPTSMVEGLRLFTPSGDTTYVSSLGEYRHEKKRGCYAYSTFEMDVAYQYFERPLQILNVLKVAEFAEHSHVYSPHRGLSDLHLLPATLLFCTEDVTSDEAFKGEREKLKGKTMQQLLDAGDAILKSVSSDHVAIEHQHNRTFLVELLRADTNGDGLEEIVIHWGGGPVDGTLRIANVRAITRSSADSIFSEVTLLRENDDGQRQ